MSILLDNDVQLNAGPRPVYQLIVEEIEVDPALWESWSSVTTSSERMDWETPRLLSQALDAEFAFDLDPCCRPYNAKCDRFFTEREDGLWQPWAGNVFMNPPCGRMSGEWVEKAYRESQRARRSCLVPSRTGAAWWHDCVMEHAAEVRFVRSRIAFVGAVGVAPFPAAIIVFRPGRHAPIYSTYRAPNETPSRRRKAPSAGALFA